MFVFDIIMCMFEMVASAVIGALPNNTNYYLFHYKFQSWIAISTIN